MQELTYRGIRIGLKGSGARYLGVNRRTILANSSDRRLYQQLRRRGMPVKFINHHFGSIRAAAFAASHLAERYDLPITVRQPPFC